MVGRRTSSESRPAIGQLPSPYHPDLTESPGWSVRPGIGMRRATEASLLGASRVRAAMELTDRLAVRRATIYRTVVFGW
jgi:hypothetical protein